MLRYLGRMPAWCRPMPCRSSFLISGPYTESNRAVEVAAALEDTTRHKPEPDPLLHAAASLGAQPCDCVYVGDATVDVLAARAAGMAAIAVGWGAADREALAATGPDALVDTVADLTAYLLGHDEG